MGYFGLRKPVLTEERRREFEELLIPHYRELFASALRLTRNIEDAEDLVQDTATHAFQGFHRFQKGSNFKAWLMKILMNTYINTYRKKQRSVETISLEALWQDSEEALDIYEVIADSQKDPAEEVMSQLTDYEVQKALDALPEVYREVIVLCDINELSYKEISDMLRIPLGTVRSRISRGRELLRHSLEDYARRRNLI